MTKTIQYQTQEGERWDTVSQKMYGNPYEVRRIIEANLKAPISERIMTGAVLEIPVLEDNTVEVNRMLLPPWKRDL